MLSGAGRAFLVIAETDTREVRTNGGVTASGEPRGRARARRSRRNTRRNRLGLLDRCDIYVKSMTKTSSHDTVGGPWETDGAIDDGGRERGARQPRR